MSTKNARVLIYALHHPSSLHVYVGKSSRPVRLVEHFQKSKLRAQKGWPKSKWIVALRKKGLVPEATVLEVTTKRNGDEAERFHIAYFRSLGFLLLNLTDGGEANWRWSTEVRAKISAAHKGKRKSDETRLKMSIAARAKWLRPGYREEQIAKQKALVTTESRARSAEAAKLASHDWHRGSRGRKIHRQIWNTRRANIRAQIEQKAMCQRVKRARKKRDE